MTALSLRPASEEQKNVKELFETIGIPYDASFSSPNMKGFVKTPSSKKLLSDLPTNKDKSKRVQTSAMKNCEPETARRRRDSLDQVFVTYKVSSYSSFSCYINMPTELSRQIDLCCSVSCLRKNLIYFHFVSSSVECHEPINSFV